MNAPMPWDRLQLAARAGVFAENLPSNRALPNDVTEESLQLGWTVQQPYVHVTSPITFTCILCGGPTDPRDWTAHLCPVQELLGDSPWTVRS